VTSRVVSTCGAALRACCSALISVPSSSSRTPAAAGLHGGYAGRYVHRRPPEGVHEPQAHAAQIGLLSHDLYRMQARWRAVHSHDDRIRHDRPSSHLSAGPDCRSGRPALVHRRAPSSLHQRATPRIVRSGRRANRPREAVAWRHPAAGVRLEEQ
jgi:hypothetical protein